MGTAARRLIHTRRGMEILPGDKREEGKIGAPLPRLTIKFITRYKACKRMVAPASEEAWNQRIGHHDWATAWQLKTLYATPRDRTPHLQLQHRTLTVAKHGPWSEKTRKDMRGIWLQHRREPRAPFPMPTDTAALLEPSF